MNAAPKRTAKAVTISPAAITSRGFSSQNVRHLRVWSAKYSHQEGRRARKISARNAQIIDTTTAVVQVHSQFRMNVWARSVSGASRSRTRFGTGNLMWVDRNDSTGRRPGGRADLPVRPYLD